MTPVPEGTLRGHMAVLAHYITPGQRVAGSPAVDSHDCMTSAVALARIIHEANVAAGWWTDLSTGESLIGKRNVPEMLMLTVSELCEAAEGIEGGLSDDKLPHRPMFEVEIADALIRVFDLAGGTCPHFGQHIRHVATLVDVRKDEALMSGVRYLGEAMEGYRKGKLTIYSHALAQFVLWCVRLGEYSTLDLPGALEEKFIFNQSRADHKLDARRAEGGKAF